MTYKNILKKLIPLKIIQFSLRQKKAKSLEAANLI